MKLGRITAFVLAAAFAANSFSFAAFAETKASVTNVTTEKAWDALRTRYITYTINGVKYDSREMGQETNTAAFDAMNDADREKVSRWMAAAWPSDRERQFGYSGAEKLIDNYNDVTGWKKLWEETDKKLTNYYSGDLLYVYGGPSTSEPDKYYKKEYDKLTNYPENSSVYKLLNSPEYLLTYQARNFEEEYNYIGELMTDGHEYYTMLSKNMKAATEAAIKGSSSELISIICDKMMVPVITPRSMFSTVEKEVFSGILEISDRLTGYSSKIQGIVLGDSISGKSAKELISYFKLLAEDNYNAAKLCHEQAVSLHDSLEKEAARLIKKIDEERAQRSENGKDGKVEEYYDTRDATEKARYDAIENVAPDTSLASAVAAKYPKEGDEDYPEKLAYAKEQCSKAWEGLCAEIGQKGKELNDNARTILKEAGLLELKEGDEITDEIKSEYPGVYFVAAVDGIEYVDTVRTFDIDDYPNAPHARQLVGERYGVYDGFSYEADSLDLLNEADLVTLNTEKYFYLEWLKKVEKMYEAGTDLAPAFEQKTQNIYLTEGAKIRGWDVVSKQTELFASMGDWHIEKGGHANPEPFIAANAIAVISEFPDLWYIEDAIADINRNYDWVLEWREKTLAKNKKWEEATKQYTDDYRARYQRWLEGEQAKVDYLKSGVPDFVYIQADGGNGISDGTVQLYADGAEPYAGNADALKGLSREEYAALSEKCAAAYEQYYALADAAEAAELDFRQANTVFEYVYTHAPGGFSYIDEIRGEREEASRIWHDGDFLPNERESSALYYLPMLWRDFDTRSTCNLEIKKQTERIINESGNLKRRAKTLEYSKETFENLYARELRRAIADAQNCSYVPAKIFTDNAAEDLEAQANAVIADITAVYDDPGSYTPAEGLTDVSNTVIGLSAGQSQTLSAAVYPSDASDKRIVWESLTPDIASVDENGVVTALADGTAVIRAYPRDSEMEYTASADGAYNVIFPDVYEPLPQYMTEFTVTVRGGASAFVFGDADGDDMITASDATAVMQKTLIDSMQLPLQSKTDDWLKY
ncbi:MAG: Ig-like domain-containing protein, partial [Firmicutes bacterium]|nr:Ig-like domain-containing protein [Bacillota bacterium]